MVTTMAHAYFAYAHSAQAQKAQAQSAQVHSETKTHLGRHAVKRPFSHDNVPHDQAR